jgi:GT2 family glycosyltransferase
MAPTSAIQAIASPSVSAIICAYNDERWDDLVAAVSSLHHQIHRPEEIIVVIDHNPDLLARAQAELRGVGILANAGQPGLSGARNSGIAAARGDVIAFLDDDAVASSDWIEHLVASYARPDVVGAGGAIAPDWSAKRPRWFPSEFDWVVGCTYTGMPDTAAPVRNLIGCNMSFRREVFEALGGFSDGIGRIGTRPLGCEETELCIRVRQQWPDKVLLYNPRIHVRHRVPERRAHWRYFFSRCYSEGLSKACIARTVGAQAALASEKAYTTRVLPVGIIRNLTSVARRGDLGGFGRATAIALGLLVTVTGYAYGKTAALTLPDPSTVLAADPQPKRAVSKRVA